MSFADRNLLEQVVTPEVLVPHSAKMSDYMEGLRSWKALTSEARQLGVMQDRYGAVHHVALIPSPVRAAILQVMPDAFTDKKMFYGLLDGPLRSYDVRGKIIL